MKEDLISWAMSSMEKQHFKISNFRTSGHEKSWIWVVSSFHNMLFYYYLLIINTLQKFSLFVVKKMQYLYCKLCQGMGIKA